MVIIIIMLYQPLAPANPRPVRKWCTSPAQEFVGGYYNISYCIKPTFIDSHDVLTNIKDTCIYYIIHIILFIHSRSHAGQEVVYEPKNFSADAPQPCYYYYYYYYYYCAQHVMR